ncbi:MAG: gluconolaconase, partial [Verrucomicrobiae bacterium]|nr:gluconolaconase [Verrucomicrobiae bacterium]
MKTFSILSVIIGLSLCLIGCSRETETTSTRFPVDVGERPESITKGWDGNYFVTVMNGQIEGDGVVKVIKGNQVTVFASGLSEPKGIAFVAGHLVVSDLKQVVQIDSNGKTSVLAGPGDFPHPPSYLN